MSRHASDFAGLPIEASDENALLRAALAEAHQRIGELEQGRFRAELERVVGLAERHGTSAAVVGIALTNLADLEERHGPLAVEAALIHVAGLLSGLIRSTDILVRTGEAEFGLILDRLDHNSAIDAAERLARCIADHPLDLGRGAATLAATVAATGIMPGDRAEEVLARAERNLALARMEA